MLWISLSPPTLMTRSAAWAFGTSAHVASSAAASNRVMESSLGIWPRARKACAMRFGPFRAAFRTVPVQPAARASLLGCVAEALVQPLRQVEAHEGRSGKKAAPARHLDTAVRAVESRRAQASPRSIGVSAEMAGKLV